MRNARRQRRLEVLLSETAEQLEEATRHLDEASRQMAAARKSECTPAPAAARVRKQPAPANPKRHTPAAAARRAYQPQASAPATGSTDQAARTSMILRMQREGESPASIADKLDLPLAQVRLLLKLQAATQHS
ncbi:MAG: hypothetical protein R8L58_02395, partial [Mariprofundaceae bacterium]